MKTVILMRHSQPDATSTEPNERIPLSEEGIRKANAFFDRSEFEGIGKVAASPYKRAYSTAQFLGAAVKIDGRLAERRIGEENKPDVDFWEKQYQDPDFRDEGGESLREAGSRIADFMRDLLNGMHEEEKGLIVSHAAAICGYLMKYCKVSVTDAKKKLRRIEFDGNVILDGKIETPSAFVLSFEGEALMRVRYIK